MPCCMAHRLGNSVKDRAIYEVKGNNENVILVYCHAGLRNKLRNLVYQILGSQLAETWEHNQKELLKTLNTG